MTIIVLQCELHKKYIKPPYITTHTLKLAKTVQCNPLRVPRCIPHQQVCPGEVDDSSLLEVLTEEVQQVQRMHVVQVLLVHVLQLFK